MSSNRLSAVGLSARLVGGVVVAAAAVLGVGAAIVVPGEGVAASRPAITAQPAAGTTLLGCSGPLFAVGRDAANAQALSVAEFARFVTSQPAGLREDSVDVVSIADITTSMFSVPANGDQRVAAAAAGSVAIATPDLAGFAAYGCQPAAMQSWIVGAETNTGTTGVLTLVNPGEVTATVDVTVYGTAGPQTVPGSTGIVVAAKSLVTVDLAALAGDEIGPVLRIDAHDTPILANLQSGIVRTLVTGGVDVQSAVATASTTQVVPGIVVSDSGDGAMEFQRARLLAPETTTTAQVSLREVGATTDAFTTTVTADGGIPLDVQLPPLPAGTYAMTVTAEQPVVAGVWSTTGFDDGSDYAWATAAPSLSVGETPFAVAEGDAAALTLVNSSDVVARVRVESSAGGREYSLAAGDVISVAVAGGTSGTITVDSGTVHAAVSYDGEDAIAMYPVWPADAAATPVVVQH